MGLLVVCCSLLVRLYLLFFLISSDLNIISLFISIQISYDNRNEE